MKRKLPAIFIAVLLLLALCIAPPAAFADDAITVLVNGQPLYMDVPPVIEGGYTLVPVRVIAESLGAYVEWHPLERRVEIELDEHRLVLIIDNTIAYVDGVPKQLEAPARIVNGATMVPARFISESLRAEVNWYPDVRVVGIVTYENVAPYSAALAQMEDQVLQELNSRRAKLSRAPLLAVEELRQMARGHAAELAQNNAFSHSSARFGDTASRAAARGLKINFEYLAYGLPDAAAIVDGLVSGEQGGRLLAEDARFFGLGMYKGGQEGNADMMAVAELTEGDGFLLGPRQRRLNTPELTLSGYAASGAPLTVYQLDAQGDYLARQSYAVNVDGAGRFSFSVNLWQQGRFAAVIGSDSVILIYE